MQQKETPLCPVAQAYLWTRMNLFLLRQSGYSTSSLRPWIDRLELYKEAFPYEAEVHLRQMLRKV